jgi:hypothetical protein
LTGYLAWVVEFDPQGNLYGVWHDGVDYGQFGRVHVERASTVEYDPTSGEWVATTLSAPTGTQEILASGPQRDPVVHREVQTLQSPEWLGRWRKRAP